MTAPRSDSASNETTGSLLWRVSLRWRGEVDRAVTPLGLTHATYSVFAPLYGLERTGVHPSQRELAERASLEPLYVSKLVRTLEQLGFVTRTRHPLDSRAFELRITDSGREVITQAIEIVRRLHVQLTAPLGGPDSARTTALRSALQALLSDDRRNP